LQKFFFAVAELSGHSAIASAAIAPASTTVPATHAAISFLLDHVPSFK
jgi:hypothetical protein